jgi:prepilin-type processing-associated H-X9-DG protein
MEVLVVIGIVAALAGITIPAVLKARSIAYRVDCTSNLGQIAAAVHQYSDQWLQLPQGCYYPFSRTPRERADQVGMSWQTCILPYIEQGTLWALALKAQKEEPSDPYELSAHDQVRQTVLPIYLCPAETRRMGGMPVENQWALTSYMGVAGTSDTLKDGIFHVAYTVRFRDITDGTSHTLMVGERPPGPKGIDGAWYSGWGNTTCPLSQILPARRGVYEEGDCPIIAFRPGVVQDPCDLAHFWSAHSGGANFALADGAVRFLTYDATAPILPMLATRAGGEAVDVP